MIFAPLVAGAALSGTAVVDRTVSCRVPVQAGIPIVTLTAAPVWTFTATDGTRKSLNAYLFVHVDAHGLSNGVTLLGVANVPNGFAAPDANWCKPASRIPLAPSGLPSGGVYTSPGNGIGDGNGARCASATTITVRLRATILKGVAVSAQLAVRSGRQLRPVAFVDWRPKKVTTYLEGDCQS